MKTNWLGKCVQGRPTFRTIRHHLLVDILPILLMLLAMAIGMALVSSKAADRWFFSGPAPQAENRFPII